LIRIPLDCRGACYEVYIIIIMADLIRNSIRMQTADSQVPSTITLSVSSQERCRLFWIIVEFGRILEADAGIDQWCRHAACVCC